MVRIKVCGVTRLEDALVCADAGVDTIGLNFYRGTPRYCDPDVARAIVDAVGHALEVVGVFVNEDEETVRRLQDRTGITWVQLHGDEPPEMVQRFLPSAFKAIRATGPEGLARARAFPGEHLLLDASVPGEYGGTGHRADWDLAQRLASERRLTLAGGLKPENVAEAIAAVGPYRVDTASGVESAPGRKDSARIRAFVEAVRGTVASGEVTR